MSHKMVANSILLLTFVVACSAAKVPVTIYYESLCPDSAKFITEQVYPAVRSELRDVVDVQFVPFGKSQFTTQGSEVNFQCHHGLNECYGNKVHACAIEHIQDNSYEVEFTRQSLTLDFINCLMKAGKNFPDNVYPGARCANENHINAWENIKQCANTTEGSQLLRKQGEITNKFQNPLISVPTVVFNQQYDSSVNERAMTNFVGTICKYVSMPQPRICASQNGAASLSVSKTLSSLFGLCVYALSRLL